MAPIDSVLPHIRQENGVLYVPDSYTYLDDLGRMEGIIIDDEKDVDSKTDYSDFHIARPERMETFIKGPRSLTSTYYKTEKENKQNNI